VGEAAARTLTAIAEFVAPAGWTRIDVISDLHLAADMPRTFAAWATWLRATPADAVFILGDLFDAWVGDDARYEGFEAECTAVLAEAAKRIGLAFMVGNRDFLAGPAWAEECGLTLLADPTLLVAFGRRVLLTHGDALCLADTEYQRFRAQVRSPAWQAMVLALPLAERRRRAAQMRHASEQRHAIAAPQGDAADIDFAAAGAWLREAGAPVLIHGHTHRPATEGFGAGFTRHVLSDWDCDGPAPRAQVLRLTRDGIERLPALVA
jgi:UDP-2,3-diacylglucosamine hydrolase